MQPRGGTTFPETLRSGLGIKMLTGDADSCLAALGRPQVAPGDAQTPVVLRAVEVLHLLPRHVDHHLADLQPCRQRWLMIASD